MPKVGTGDPRAFDKYCSTQLTFAIQFTIYPTRPSFSDRDCLSLLKIHFFPDSPSPPLPLGQSAQRTKRHPKINKLRHMESEENMLKHLLGYEKAQLWNFITQRTNVALFASLLCSKRITLNEKELGVCLVLVKANFDLDQTA